nr:hypothetical protein [Aliarcobacter butzleri]
MLMASNTRKLSPWIGNKKVTNKKKARLN